MTDEEIKTDALQRYPDCKYAEVVNGLNFLLGITRVANLYRNEECWAAGDPPKHVVEGYPRYER
jgi:hypothetical protein